MTNSTEEERISKKEIFGRSEEIECQLGLLTEPKLILIHRQISNQRHISYGSDHVFGESYESSKTRSTVNDYDIESRDASFINFSEIHRRTGTSWMAAVIIMANCTIGMGLLNFPYAFAAVGGILLAMMAQLAIFGCIIVSLMMMCYASQYYGDVTYQGVVGSHIGRIAQEICRVLIFLNNFGALAVGLVVIGDQFGQIERSISAGKGYSHWILDRKVIVPIISIVLIFPLCFLKNFGFFKYTSFLGVAAAGYISFGLMIPRYFTMSATHFKPLNAVHPTNLVKIIPLICFSFECHIEIPPMIACLRSKDKWFQRKMIFGYVILLSLIYSTTGIFGYLTFGANTPDDILLAYEPNDPLLIIAMILLSVKIITTYPVIFYCLRIVIEDYFKTLFIKHQDSRYFETFLKIIITTVLFSSTVLISIFIPNITSVINVIGGISAAFIFIYPGLCYLKIYSPRLMKWRWSEILLGALYIIIGVFVAAMSTTYSLIEFIKY